MSSATTPPDSDPNGRRRIHSMLKLYYGLNEEGKAADQAESLDPCDINGPHFDPEIYLNKLRKECSLGELMDHESCMVKQIRSLDSDMQTLVYENYNKFISATDTIRKMKNDFKKMEDEMDCLSANMASITEFSARISGTLQDQHAQITKLSGVHTLLRKLQFLFELPARLNKCLELQAYAQAVSSHRRARCVLQQYSHMPSFRGIQDDCHVIMEQLAQQLRQKFRSKLLPGSAVPSHGTEIVVQAARERIKQYLSALQTFYHDSLTDVRQALAAPRLAVGGASASGGGASSKDATPSLPELLASLSNFILNQLKSVLASVHLFTAKDITFSNKPYFKGEFCSQGVREGLVVSFIKFICQSSRQYCESAGDRGGSTPPALLLLLSRLCLDYETSTISYILTLTDEQFLVQHHTPVTPVTALCAEAREAAQKLLNHYVKVQGLIISQMLRKSVETRDWVNTIEPRNVRAVMKRVVEDTTSIDVQVGLLYEEGVRKAHSSDSSKRTFSVYSSSRQQIRYAPSYTPSAPMDTNLLSNIHKLFSERIDIFSPVEFNKVSVLTGIIKISLKTFLECVRLRTFGRYGLQQIQVDCHYLQMYLWRFVSDENLVHFLLDEIVCSAAHRCLDPSPMEQSVIEVICERG
ncbi:hypothetical protein cypCar_00006374 [Cyprinus carpio]|nr:hypothetical protein cypCar_00006374 [Cyprinus carpio]